jgi:hypothetical protein
MSVCYYQLTKSARGKGLPSVTRKSAMEAIKHGVGDDF